MGEPTVLGVCARGLSLWATPEQVQMGGGGAGLRKRSSYWLLTLEPFGRLLTEVMIPCFSRCVVAHVQWGMLYTWGLIFLSKHQCLKALYSPAETARHEKRDCRTGGRQRLQLGCTFRSALETLQLVPMAQVVAMATCALCTLHCTRCMQHICCCICKLYCQRLGMESGRAIIRYRGAGGDFGRG